MVEIIRPGRLFYALMDLLGWRRLARIATRFSQTSGTGLLHKNKRGATP